MTRLTRARLEHLQTMRKHIQERNNTADKTIKTDETVTLRHKTPMLEETYDTTCTHYTIII